MKIHPTAVVDPGAKLGKNVEIGPYAVIEADTVLGDDCYVDAHAKVARHTTVGDRTRIYYGALVGEEPQDHRFVPGVVSATHIGADSVIREYVTIHRSPFEHGETRVGDHTLLMAFVHVGHDAVIGNRVTVANHSAISGHVVIEDRAVLSGHVLIHQFCRVGSLAMVGGRLILTQDVPPFCMLTEHEVICGPNTIGLRRAGFDSELRTAIRRAIKTYFFYGLNARNALRRIEETGPGPEIRHFIEFIRQSTRGIMPGDPALAAIAQKSEQENI